MNSLLPADHTQRLARARASLEGLSIGDAFGQRFFFSQDEVERMLSARAAPEPPWYFTDDTVMALGLYTILKEHGTVDQDSLALEFARQYSRDPWRGYGGTAHEILRAIGEGTSWRVAAPAAFSGMGSLGNGGAMRVAPLGAYFSDNLDEAARQARLSAEVTHSHPEGQAGAIAVAIAAAFAAHLSGKIDSEHGTKLLECVLEHVPPGETRTGIEKASGLSRELSVVTAASFLGNGSRVSAQDTVPFTLWCAARHLDNFSEALWTTVAGLGDRDTTCAIVGGIVALSAGADCIPNEWLAAREPLPGGTRCTNPQL